MQPGWKRLLEPPWRTLVAVVTVGLSLLLVYALWQPGPQRPPGRYDRRENGLWIQHGWLGDDAWFARTQRDPKRFRNDGAVVALASLARTHGIRDLFPHLCPAEPDGSLPPVDRAQTERFLNLTGGLRVMPWVGGVLGEHALPDSPAWRSRFVASVQALLRQHPRLAGIHLNIEPLPDGHEGYLRLLEALRQGLPPGKLLSVAAYPPPTRWHPFPEVHWGQAYYGQVAARADQLVPMMYDTALKLPKLYIGLMADWTEEVLRWSGQTPVLLGIPAYDDAGVGYHSPKVENVQTGLDGIQAGLERFPFAPTTYRGISIYSDWELDEAEWGQIRRQFEREAAPMRAE